MEAVKKQMMKGMQRFCDKMPKKVEEKNEKLMKNMKDLFVTEVGDLKKEMGEIKKELQTSTQKIQAME